MDINKFYDSGYHSKIHANLIGDDEYFWTRARASQRLYFSHLDLAQTKILDFGGGIGQTTAGIPNAVVFDASQEAREMCRKRGFKVVDRVDAIEGNSFDVVVCRHVLEHVPYPAATLRDIYRVLSDNGHLILILPKEIHSMCGLSPDMVNYHLYCWNFQTLNNLLDFTGFRPVLHRQHYILGYRQLLPLNRLLGFEAYYWATFAVGWAWRMGELVVHARKKESCLSGTENLESTHALY
jgi:SAM-dependent methyltransferase